MQLELIDVVWQAMLWVCGLMYLLVLLFLAHALIRKRERTRQVGDVRPVPQESTALGRILVAWAALIVVGLGALFTASLLIDRALARAAVPPALRLKVSAQQWWWEIEYESPEAARRLRTANEIHLPVDTPVEISLQSKDVIHSFWVPELNGKVDLIPDRSNVIRIQARRPGRYRGQCAEFCGLQHAHMAFDVVVQTRDDFRAWFEHQLAPANAPANPDAQHGQAVFLRSACAACHAVTGLPAYGTVGPDLTHVASRLRIAAGTLPADAANFDRWIRNPQQFKPGSRMPIVDLGEPDRRAVAAWLATLR